MGILRKTLSIILGSPEETLVNAKSEISRALGSTAISNNTERNYIFDKVVNDVRLSPLYGIHDINFVVLMVLNNYVDNWNGAQMQILARVLVDYYGYLIGNVDTLPNAVSRLAEDICISRRL